jgi:hypothetical protein
MAELETVLHKPTLPPNDERWHIIIQGDPKKLLDALAIIAVHEQSVIQTAEWVAEDELVICLHWIDDVISRLVENDIYNVSFDITIKYNGRGECHGHNL